MQLILNYLYHNATLALLLVEPSCIASVITIFPDPFRLTESLM